jgi:two-component system, OmpR family, sensor histidine kinase MprB
MSFRTRLTLVAAAAVAFTILLVAPLVYVVVRNQLRTEVDEGLSDRAAQILRRPLDAIPTPDGKLVLRIPGPALGGPGGYVQAVSEDGTTIRLPGATVPIPINDRVLDVATGERNPFFYDTAAGDTHVRVFTVPVRPGYAIQVARPLTEVDDALEQIRTYLFVIALAGVAVAVGLGLLVSRAAVAPVTRLTEATERVTETGDLSERIDAGGEDELSRLAGSFNTMLAALEESARAQRQLVADASHELRTPLTSLRTNFEVLMSERELPPDERRRLLDDVVEQIAEMTTLIAGLIELARGDEYPTETENVRLDLLTADAVERARRDRPGVTFVTSLQESVVRGVPASLERAIANLLDNAAKWSPPGGEIDVEVEDGTVTVRDHGPGIADEDLPFVFDRFYRSRSARTMPGSGLGLAIVRQTVEAHGGSVLAERAEGGGTRVILRLDGRREHTASTDADLVTADS